MARLSSWDTELYEAQHSFVWKLGLGLLEDLDPQPGQRILDLGCGTGQLTNSIAERGADVLGLDASPDMIGQARQNYPRLRFLLQDATAMQFQSEFDAVFSNAALHWIPDGSTVALNIFRALRHGGRFIAELGGKGNIGQIESSIQTILRRYLGQDLPRTRTWFPSIGEYSSILENSGLQVSSALLFERPTPLAGERGLEEWIQQFASYYFEPLPPARRPAVMTEIVENLRPVLFKNGQWFADYRRLRITAIKR